MPRQQRHTRKPEDNVLKGRETAGNIPRGDELNVGGSHEKQKTHSEPLLKNGQKANNNRFDLPPITNCYSEDRQPMKM